MQKLGSISSLASFTSQNGPAPV